MSKDEVEKAPCLGVENKHGARLLQLNFTCYYCLNMKLGATFSHRHLQYLGLDVKQSAEQYVKLGFNWVRLGCYWDEIEKEKGKFDFSRIEELLQFFEKNKVKVLLTVGMKAPRWPEYYLPEWIKKEFNLKYLGTIKPDHKLITDNLYPYLEKTVNHLKKFTCINSWQVENEPLNPFGEKRWRISPEILQKEIAVIRKNDKREITLNFGAGVASMPFFWNKIKDLDFDNLGLNIYFKVATIKGVFKYFPYVRNYSQVMVSGLINKARNSGKKIYLTELQSEPWEPDELVAHSDNPPSFMPEDFKKNLEKINSWDIDVVFLWGYEYWLWRKLIKGDNSYWQEAKNVIPFLT